MNQKEHPADLVRDLYCIGEVDWMVWHFGAFVLHLN